MATLAPSLDFLHKANDVIRATLFELRPQLLKASGQIEHSRKADDSVVTQMDVMVEERLKAALAELEPGIGFAGEETGANYNQPLFWLVDPIDGTEPFVRGLPFFTTMIALIHDGRPLMAVIYNHSLDEYLHAIRGHGTTLNGHPVAVSSRELKRSFLHISVKPTTPELAAIAGTMRSRVKSVVGFGASGAVLSAIAKGSIEGSLNHSTASKPWDMAPGALLVEEAGGKVTNVGSGDFNYLNTDVIFSNGVIHDELVETLAAALPNTK